MTTEEIKEKLLTRWVEELELDALQTTCFHYLMQNTPVVEIARPFVIRDISKGMSRPLLVIRYGLSNWQIRQIGIDAGLYVCE